MGIWTDLETDVSEIIQDDGEEAFITVGTAAAVRVLILWEGTNVEGSAQGGPYAWAADTDLPSPLPQGSILQYRGTNYTIGPIQPDGHGLTMMTLTDESCL